ncbi:serine peptidase, family S28 [Aspergillus heteromorphus CBS 117.55]|uniref:Serine peptidase, family S28 n=1 Tax=Aspergillus heteromorphus CBS 117.55 TaxID=1448321 RepID=A0A317V6K0_9EURO|nr:serine peptidase, family S28 [Aspergillus heteromorphus CBS 117.55]PWY69696.1 serine peptidase, family S28 [Aspergillus heteromorphus CBS 117.55]
MHYYSLCIAVAGLLVTRPVVGSRHGKTPFGRDLQLLAQLGISPDLRGFGHHDLQQLVSHSAMATALEAETITIPLDHDNSSAGTYENRFWVNDEFFEPGKPIMLYDAGETNAEATAYAHLTSSLSFFRPMLEEFHAMGIVWEHRYYGESTPCSIDFDTPPETLKYLDTKQSLADIPYFARNFSRESYPDVDLTPQGTPWIMVGGSYAGVRAALTRNEYPETIFAAFSSSAPVEARMNMTMYFDQIYRGMIASGWTNCTLDIRAALNYIDDQLSSDETASSIKRLFFGSGAENNTNGDFTAALTGIYGFFQNYGMAGGTGGLGSFCKYLETDPNTNKTAGADGLATIYGNKFMAERWAQWPVFTELVNENMDTNCQMLNTSRTLDCDFSKPYGDASAISWTWQYCSEWGFYQANNEGPHALLSRYQTLEYQQEVCNRQFPSAIPKGLLPPQPLTEELNHEHGGWTIRPSNVYFSGGEFDPWRSLSLLSTEDVAPQGIQFSSQIPDCGVKTTQDTVFGYIMENSEHCFDFQAAETVGKLSRGIFTSALLQWLPCFGQQTAVHPTRLEGEGAV